MNHLKMCRCRACRRGLRRRAWTGAKVRRLLRAFRRDAKADLKNGVEPERVVSTGYTW